MHFYSFTFHLCTDIERVMWLTASGKYNKVQQALHGQSGYICVTNNTWKVKVPVALKLFDTSIFSWMWAMGVWRPWTFTPSTPMERKNAEIYWNRLYSEEIPDFIKEAVNVSVWMQQSYQAVVVICLIITPIHTFWPKWFYVGDYIAGCTNYCITVFWL